MEEQVSKNSAISRGKKNKCCKFGGGIIYKKRSPGIYCQKAENTPGGRAYDGVQFLRLIKKRSASPPTLSFRQYKDTKNNLEFPGCGAFPRWVIFWWDSNEYCVARNERVRKEHIAGWNYSTGALFFPVIVLFFPFQNMKYVSSPGFGQFMSTITLGSQIEVLSFLMWLYGESIFNIIKYNKKIPGLSFSQGLIYLVSLSNATMRMPTESKKGIIPRAPYTGIACAKDTTTPPEPKIKYRNAVNLL